MKNFIKISILFIASWWMQSASASPILLMNKGILSGANGVVVDGKSYDVRFKDNTCVALFHGCLQDLDFAFHNVTDALTATAALNEQVLKPFQENQSGKSMQINGCEDSFECWIDHPIEIIDENFVRIFSIDYVYGSDQNPFWSETTAWRDADYSNFSNIVYAVWRPVGTQDVPEPSSILLLMVGCLGLMANKSKSRRIQF